MTAWLVRRVAASIAIVFAVVTLTFVLIHLAPGQPFVPGAETPIDPGVVTELRRQFGLDQSLPVQYAKYLGALVSGHLGESFALHRPVADALADAIPNTLVLTGTALCIDLLLGLALGVYQAVRARRLPDVGLGYATLFLNSVPTFWLGLLVLLVFGEWLRWFPVGGVVNPVLHASLPWAGRVADRLWHLALPALTLGCVGAAGTARYQRAAMLEVIGQDYVRTARAKGLRERRVVLVHALRNALLPLVTIFGLSFPFLLTGAVLVETVFAWPGMGKLAADAIFRRDYPVVMAAAICASGLVVLGNLLADVLYALADPRIRVQDGVSTRATLALLGALAVALFVVNAARRRAATSPAGRRFFNHPPAALGLFTLAFFATVALAAPWVAPYDPSAQLEIVTLKNQAPSLLHPLGTDLYSRDVWSRLAYGARVSLSIAALAMLVAVTLGALVGAVAGYLRGWVDPVLMRTVDVGLAIPRIFLLLMAIALWEHLPLWLLVLVIGITGWFPTSRIVRAEVLTLRERDFVAAARALGAGPMRIIVRHVLPNVAAPIIVSAALGIGNVMLLEAGLSFLGIGVQPPLPSWGNMIADGASQLSTAWWTTVFPGLTIALVVMSLHAVGDALRDALDPRRAAA